jgi:two-component system chemotaxis response regulator CheY
MKSLRILVVEDEFLSRNLLARMIMRYGSVDNAVDGNEAVTAIKAAYEEGKPYDLIFLDIMMPVKDGQTTLLELRGYEEARGIPPTDTCKVVMVTALGDAKNVMTAFKSQCEGYLTKPYSMESVQEIVEKLAKG